MGSPVYLIFILWGLFFTWSREGCESRLDHILANNMFMDRFTKAITIVLYNFKSDHKAFVIDNEGVSLFGCF